MSIRVSVTIWMLLPITCRREVNHGMIGMKNAALSVVQGKVGGTHASYQFVRLFTTIYGRMMQSAMDHVNSKIDELEHVSGRGWRAQL